jgi:hypothetical protein
MIRFSNKFKLNLANSDTFFMSLRLKKSLSSWKLTYFYEWNWKATFNQQSGPTIQLKIAYIFLWRIDCIYKTWVIFIWSIFIRAVIDHMTCYNLNWPKIEFWVHYFVFFLCFRSYPEKVEKYISIFYKIRHILEELCICSSYVNYKPAYNLHWPDEQSHGQFELDVLL